VRLKRAAQLALQASTCNNVASFRIASASRANCPPPRFWNLLPCRLRASAVGGRPARARTSTLGEHHRAGDPGDRPASRQTGRGTRGISLAMSLGTRRSATAT